MKRIDLTSPEGVKALRSARKGELLLLDGPLYTARDQAHRRLKEDLSRGKPPFDLRGKVIYYCGPTPAPKGMVVGSCGPTSSYRMDKYADMMEELGVVALIGKGERSASARRIFKRAGIRYLIAPGGAGAYLARRVVRTRVVAYPDLGPEAIYEFWVEGFPVVVDV